MHDADDDEDDADNGGDDIHDDADDDNGPGRFQISPSDNEENDEPDMIEEPSTPV